MADSREPASIPLAIIGMACRLPGADNLDAYWRLVIEGRTAIAEMPADRLNQELYYDPKVGTRGKTYSKLAAMLSSRTFDRAACPISDELQRSVDLAHLLMCEVSAAALRHARLDPFALPERNVGVYIGHAQGSSLASDYTYASCVEEAAHFLNEVEEYRKLPAKEQQEILAELVATIRADLPRRTKESADVDASLVAGTVSKAFGLTGPFLAINSACASSLQSILLAARALQLGRIDMAIAGGASDCKSDSLVLFSNAQAMSSTGSRPFDSEADGLICGEGYAAIVMKTLDKALSDGDRVLAVIRGLGVASDGRGKSLWAPRKEGQIEAMRRAYRHGVDMSRLQYIEAHATATQLGDATELNTLAEALTGVLPKGTKIPVTSVKANIGHTLETAGIAGVIKAIMCMHNGMFAPAIGIRELNPKIDWANVPYYVPRAATPWPAPADGHPRRAAVNAFGIGGLNMHVVIDQYTEAARPFFQPAPAVRQRSADGEAIAIIGRGCILPGAKDVPSYWQMLTSGVDPKCDVPDGRWRTDLFHQPGSAQPFRSPTKLGGFVQGFAYDWKRHKVPPKQIAEADPLQFMLLDAADQAMREAGYDQKPFNRQASGVVVGTEFGGDFAFQLQMGLRIPHMEHVLRGIFQRRGLAGQGAAIIPKFSATLIKKWPALIDETGSFSTSSLASRISKTWDMMGGAAAIDAGGSSALAGLAISIDMLLAGDVDLMVCAAGQRRLGLPQYEAQAINGTLATNGQPRSRFDAQAQGHVPGEGVGVLLLKRLADARKDGDRVIGIIRGVGAGHSASHGQSLQLALDRSFDFAAADPADVAIMEADGIATPVVRDAELVAIAAVYGQGPRRRPLVLSSQVSRIGHLDGAAGMASLVKASLEVEHGEFPAEAGLTQPAPQIASAPQVLRTAAQSGKVELTSRDGRRMAGVSTASRGLSYHVVLEYGSKVPVVPIDPPAAPRQAAAPAAVAALSSARIVRLGGASASDVKAKVDVALQKVEDAFAAAVKVQFHPADICRLAIVADSPTALAEKLKLAQSQLGNPASRNVLDQQGIFFRDVYATRPRIAFAFAGQGSQYTGMLKELVSQEPAAAQAVAAIDQVLSQCGCPSFAQLAWDPSAALGIDPWNTQASLLLADRVIEQTLAARGIRPEVVFGHSYGEYAALTAAGVWDLATGLAVTRARVAGIEACKAARGGMLATSASPDVIQQVAMEHRLPVYVANHNAADQTVVGGQIDHLQQLATKLQGRSIRSQMLPVPCPFHTPLMKDAVGPMQAALKQAALAAPGVPLVSVVTNEYVPSADAVRANLVAHNTTPVRYVDLIRRVTEERPTVLVEVGPSQTLTRLHQRILAGKGELVASDNPKRPGAEQLLHVQALLECIGALDQPAAAAIPKPAAKSSVLPGKTMQHEIIEFDATARRREKMRSGGKVSPPSRLPEKIEQAASPQAASPPKAAAATAVAAPPRPVLPPTRMAPPPAPVPPAPAPAAASSNGDAHLNGSQKESAAPAKPAKPASNLNPQELEKFLINFVVEQTGYPPEVVELDADLEADLGIDSIKKAQLFGELQEYFDVTPTENLTLDDFPTLRHVLNFLQGVGESSRPAPRVEPALQTAASAAASLTIAPAPSETTAKMTGASTEELEKFLINFVVEQTGYPPEVVELDADLEADLGIDSIKKAQLFGELQEYFDVTPTENLTLDDFPTLRHVLNFLQGSSVKSDLAPAVAAEPTTPTRSVSEEVTSAPPTQKMTAASPEELEKFLINFVVEQTGYPPEVVELDADLEADLGIDSIKKAQLFGELQEYFDVTPTENLTLDDFPTLRHVLNFLQGSSVKSDLAPAVAAEPTTPTRSVSEEVTSAPPTQKMTAASPEELEKFLINFVVEQTGYPPEVVELDADLEADLGIDSIKKAQLFGELQEYFDVTPTENLTLDDFPTLRHVLNFLQGTSVKGDLATGTAPLTSGPAPRSEVAQGPFFELEAGNVAVAELPASAPPVPPIKKCTLPLVQAAGSPREIGQAIGQERAEPIRRALCRLADAGGLDSRQAGDFAPEASNSGQACEELAGLSAATGLPEESLSALGQCVLNELGAPSQLFAVRAAQGTMLGCAIDSPLSGGLQGCLSPVIQVRKPVGRIPHVLVTYDGALGGLCGANGYRLAVAGTRAAAVVGEVLASAGDVATAAQIAQGFHGSPWQLNLSEAGSDRVTRIEFDGSRHAVSQSAPPSAPSSDDSAPPSFDAYLATATRPLLSVAIDIARDRLWLKLAQRQRPGEWQSMALADYLPDPSTLPAPAPIAPPQAPLDIAPEDPSLATHRFAMRTLDRDLPVDTPAAPRWTGAALVVGRNPSADALRKQLAASGAVVVELDVTPDLDVTLAAFERLWRQQPIHHVFWMSARDPAPVDLRDPAVWQKRRYENVALPFFLCQRWLHLAGDAKLLEHCTLIVGTALGGDFGFSGHADCPDGGGLTGLVKALCLEFVIMRKIPGTMLLKAIDAPLSEPPDQLAAQILRELAGGTIDYEVAFVGGKRRLQASIHSPAALQPSAEIRPGGVWVVTGGARGITAECALELGRRYGLRLHLIGASPLTSVDPAWRDLSDDGLKDLKTATMVLAQKRGEKPNEAWDRVQRAIATDRGMQAYAAAGVRTTYHACDVSDRAALGRVLDEIRRTDGPIDGILHGAGIDRSCRYEKKQRADVLATLGSKVDGAYHLMTLTWDDPVRHFIGFGSVSGRLGSNGQADYSQASDLLVKLVTWYGSQRKECHAIAYHWHPWDEVGMAYRPDTRAMHKLTNAPALMPKREGIEHLIRELHATNREHEVLITDWDYYGRFYKSGPGPDDVVHDGVEIAIPMGKDPGTGAGTQSGSATSGPVLEGQIAQRNLMQMVDAPLPAGSPRVWRPAGPAIIVGDNPSAQALAGKLRTTGAEVEILPVGDNLAENLAGFEKLWQARPAGTVILMTARDPDAGSFLDRAAWQRRRVRGVDTPYWLVQRWFKLLAKLPNRPRACLVAATALGGDFGLGGHVFAPEGGAITGLAKSIYVEDTRKPTSEARAKVIDAPAGESPDDLADAICREMAADQPVIEVGWAAGRRRVVQHVVAPLDPRSGHDLPRGGVWVVTGGARGITAASMLELGERYGLKLHLVGKSPVPDSSSPWHHCSAAELKTIKAGLVREAVAAGRSPEEDWFRVRKDIEIQKSLAEFAARGVQATYHSCDLADWDGVARLLDEIRRTAGPISGIVHGAGYGKPMRFEVKDPKSYAKTIAGKVDGAVALLALTQNDPLRYFIGYGSISGRFGGNGLSDYAVANDMLAKLTDWFRQSRPTCATCSFHWQTWDEVGMATLSDAVGITKNTLQMDFISPREGVAHLEGELRAGLPAGEVVITDGFFQRTFYPHEFAEPSPARRPLIAAIEAASAGGHRATIRFEPDHDPFLIHHRLKDKPFLPGVVGLESLAEAAALALGSDVRVLRQVEIINGLAFHASVPIDAHVSVTPVECGVKCVLTNEHRDRKGRLINDARLCAHGFAEVAAAENIAGLIPFSEPPEGWFDYQYPDEGLLVLTGPMRRLKHFSAQDNDGWARIVAPSLAELAGPRGGQGWILPVAVLDACLVACGTWLWWKFNGRLELPYGFDRVTTIRHPREGELCTLRFAFRGHANRHSRFDFTLYGDDRQPLLVAEGYRTVLIGEKIAP